MTDEYEMEQVTLTEDMFMPAVLNCGCVSEGMYLTACIEWQEGILYIMCSHCGATKFWRHKDQQSLDEYTRKS